MLVHTQFGEVEVKLGDLFEFRSAVLTVASLNLEPRGLFCRIVSGALHEQFEDAEGNLQTKTLAEGEPLYCPPELVAEGTLRFNGPEGSQHQKRRKGMLSKAVQKAIEKPVPNA